MIRRKQEEEKREEGGGTWGGGKILPERCVEFVNTQYKKFEATVSSSAP